MSRKPSNRVKVFVEWSTEDQEYVATAPDYPGLSGVDGSKHGALRALADAINAADEIIAAEAATSV